MHIPIVVSADGIRVALLGIVLEEDPFDINRGETPGDIEFGRIADILPTEVDIRYCEPRNRAFRKFGQIADVIDAGGTVFTHAL
ncbi:hypothetical protein D3C87_2064400 [compost metagenome]